MRHFDLIVIGSGTGNSLVDERFDDWRVALIDDGERFGGTCLNHGCIPTKMFVLPADIARAPELGARLGVSILPPQVDWPAVRDRIFGRIDPLSTGGEAWRAKAPNVTLYRQTARFTGERRLEVGGEQITADKVVVAAGSRARIPKVDGLPDAFAAGRAHTSDTIMRLPELPESLVIMGAGFVAAEFVHVFSAFGTRVTVVARSGQLLRREDAEISARFTAQVGRYADLRLRHRTARVETTDQGVRVHTVDADGAPHGLDAEVLLVATGRVPNGRRLDVGRAGIATDEKGFLVVDGQQRTSAPGVWALGDVSQPRMLKHVANHEARTVQHNLLHPDAPVESNHHAIPHAVFGHPQVAAVGMSEAEARAAGHDVTVAVQAYGSTAYGWALEDTDSCVKLIADRASGRLLGGHLVGPQAATLVQPIIQAMATGLDVQTMARGQYWIHPALTEVVENALLALELDA